MTRQQHFERGMVMRMDLAGVAVLVSVLSVRVAFAQSMGLGDDGWANGLGGAVVSRDQYPVPYSFWKMGLSNGSVGVEAASNREQNKKDLIYRFADAPAEGMFRNLVVVYTLSHAAAVKAFSVAGSGDSGGEHKYQYEIYRFNEAEDKWEYTTVAQGNVTKLPERRTFVLPGGEIVRRVRLSLQVRTEDVGSVALDELEGFTPVDHDADGDGCSILCDPMPENGEVNCANGWPDTGDGHSPCKCFCCQHDSGPMLAEGEPTAWSLLPERTFSQGIFRLVGKREYEGYGHSGSAPNYDDEVMGLFKTGGSWVKSMLTGMPSESGPPPQFSQDTEWAGWVNLYAPSTSVALNPQFSSVLRQFQKGEESWHERYLGLIANKLTPVARTKIVNKSLSGKGYIAISGDVSKEEDWDTWEYFTPSASIRINGNVELFDENAGWGEVKRDEHVAVATKLANPKAKLWQGRVDNVKTVGQNVDPAYRAGVEKIKVAKDWTWGNAVTLKDYMDYKAFPVDLSLLNGCDTITIEMDSVFPGNVTRTLSVFVDKVVVISGLELNDGQSVGGEGEGGDDDGDGDDDGGHYGDDGDYSPDDEYVPPWDNPDIPDDPTKPEEENPGDDDDDDDDKDEEDDEDGDDDPTDPVDPPLPGGGGFTNPFDFLKERITVSDDLQIKFTVPLSKIPWGDYSDKEFNFHVKKELKKIDVWNEYYPTVITALHWFYCAMFFLSCYAELTNPFGGK